MKKVVLGFLVIGVMIASLSGCAMNENLGGGHPSYYDGAQTSGGNCGQMQMH